MNQFLRTVLLLVCLSLVTSTLVKETTCPKRCECKFSGRFVHCPGKVTKSEWQQIGAEISEDAIQLEVDFLDFKYVQVNCFKQLNSLTNLRILGGRVNLFPRLSDKFPALRFITFINNQIRHLPPSVFEGLEKVQNLDLAGNSLKRISKDTFKVFSELKLLNLERNQISCLDDDAFNGLSSLGLLSLNDNLLTMLPDGLFKSFQKVPLFLFFSNNRICKLQKDLFKPFLKISVFNLRHNEIAEIQDDTFDNLLPFPGFGVDLSYNPIACGQAQPPDFSMTRIRVTATCDAEPKLPLLKPGL